MVIIVITITITIVVEMNKNTTNGITYVREYIRIIYICRWIVCMIFVWFGSYLYDVDDSYVHKNLRIVIITIIITITMTITIIN